MVTIHLPRFALGLDAMDAIDPIDAMDAIGRMDKGGFGGWALVSGFKLVRCGAVV